MSVNPALNSIVRLEAIYEIRAGDHSFTALTPGRTPSIGPARPNWTASPGGVSAVNEWSPARIS